MNWIFWVFFILLAIICLVFGFVFLQYRKYQRDIPKPAFRTTSTSLHPNLWTDENVSILWIGHSTVYMNIKGFKILTDPVFSKRVGVSLGITTIGPKRHTSPAVPIHDLPKVDLVLLSHAHLDHVDLPSLRRLAAPTTPVITARGTKGLFKRLHFSDVYELGGTDQLTLSSGVTVTAVPVKHWGNRFPWNRSYQWTGYLVDYLDHRIFFAGDTAYTTTFSELGRYGSIDVAILPIGAYSPDSFQGSHCTPEQAWRMFHDTGAKWMVPVHWDTFVLSQEPVDEPMRRLLEAAGPLQEKIVIRRHGDVFQY